MNLKLNNLKNKTMKKTKLGEYYDNISNVVAPKSEFVRAIAQECNVNEMTVRGWIKGRTLPSEDRYLEVLSKHTGIEIKNLFK